MGYTKEQLLAKLKDLQIHFSQYEHPFVLTVEAQAKYVGHLGGGLSKNLFLKDKKSRFYIVSALADTKVDLKVLSQRLGLGKGGLRMAPEEALGEILRVPLGCVTPFALLNDSARDVSLLLDQGFKRLEHCFFHPLSNDMSISLNACDLDKFLKSIGREPSYVDLEENPAVGKDQPPDLVALVPSGSLVVPSLSEKPPSSQVLSKENHSADNMSAATAAKSTTPLATEKKFKDKSVNSVQSSSSCADSVFEQFVKEILDKTSKLIRSEILAKTNEQQGEQLGTAVSENVHRVLSSELKNLAMIYKSAAYTEGFHAGLSSQPKRM